MRITASNIVTAINRLPRDHWYDYISPKNSGQIKIIDIKLPEGPIVIQRKHGNGTDSISTKMIWRLANAIQPNMPINVDRVLGASYNTRSVLETLLAHTSDFYWCRPGRIQLEESTQEIKAGHKHLIWRPETPHKQGVLEKFETDMVISEIPSSSVVYEAFGPSRGASEGIDIDVRRRHLQIQIALIHIGHQLGFRTWIARNDQGFTYKDKRIGDLDGVIARLDSEKLLQAWEEARRAAMHIDCIWFRNGKFMPAVIEVEHSTGIDSGLTRMKHLKDHIPNYPTRWVIVAPDEDREKVISRASAPLYNDMNIKYFPYSAVDELYALCQHRKLNNRAVNEEFLDCFMETTRSSLPTH